MKTYLLVEGETATGPFTQAQMQSMWASGRVHAASTVQETSNPEWRQGAEFASDFIVYPSGTPVLGLLVALAGLGAGMLLGGGGLLQLVSAKNAMNESTAAILIVGGAILFVVSALGLCLISKKN